MDPVSAYLEYLREMSRKIAYRGTFLNVLYRKSKKSPDRYLSLDTTHSADVLQQYYSSVEQDIRGQDGRTLFIGIGLLTGKLISQGRSSIVAAPLYTIPVDLESDDDAGPTLHDRIEWSAASLNYDLITAVIERSSAIDPDDFVGAHDMMDPATTNAINRLEKGIDHQLTSPGYAQRFMSVEFFSNNIRALCSDVPAFRGQLTPASTPYRKDLLRHQVDEPGVRWHNHRFYFVGSMPDSLSAYEALNDLCSKLRTTT